ncbi:DNA topoisomerase VI subunit B [Nitrospira sp. KM1]|uniref:DNA topoisomerase VI subunit B n=1 Tax=Nitrospira sp. KM1 TaxID=1936990 RepID=UPI001E2F35AF|nr:DNA topoisomerase VI subunit B [Nitrospira sp. KM1]
MAKTHKSKSTSATSVSASAPSPPESAAATKISARPAQQVTAVEMGARQREISVSEFFTKNRHLLGFDSPRKSLLTCVKEAVDNALDASEEAGILPDVTVRLEVVSNGEPVAPSQATKFRITVTDNGPGIVRQQIPRIFAKLLYGSKFHRLRMSRGQQGIGISAAGMYGQLTTGKPVKIISRTGPRAAAHFFEVQIDTKKNEPLVHENKQIDWEQPQGTQVTLEVEGKYQKGRASVDEWLEQTSIANPHVKLVYHTPEGETKEYARTYHELPPSPREIKPHPYGIEFGMMLKMLQDTKSHSLSGFLSGDFCRVSPQLADEMCKEAKVSPNVKPRDLKGPAAEKLYQTVQATKIMAPPTNCISPIGEKAILSGLYKQIKGEFYTAVSRPPAVYRGNPFAIEAGLAYGNRPEDQNKPQQPAMPKAEGEDDEGDSELARVIRYANRVPLLYQQSACSTFKAVLNTTWKNYGVSQSRGALPGGPMVIFVHMASVWVPFTSESKEAIADYDEIQKEITLALRECGRRLGLFLRRRERAASEFRRRNIFELYIEEVVEACNRLKGGKLPKEKLKAQLQKIATSRTGGLKTDEALGKTGAGPEGLPHSIIVTAEGVEGEAELASQVEADAEAVSESGEPPTEKDRIAVPDEKMNEKGAGAKAKSKSSKARPGQMPLFSEKPAGGSRRSRKAGKDAKPVAPRGKK